MTNHYDFDRIDPWDVGLSQTDVSGLLSSQNRLLEGQQSQIFELQTRVSELESLCRELTRQLPGGSGGQQRGTGAIHLVAEADEASALEIPHAQPHRPVDLTVYRSNRRAIK
jgi:hypothetical protein